MAKVEDRLLDHSYDGIREYDNPLPTWWVYLFILSVIWAGVYFFYYQISGMGPTSAQEYQQEMNDYNKKYASVLAAKNQVNWNMPNFQPVTDNARLAGAKTLFAKNCTPCHGAHAQGGIGPNLTDDYWIHGNKFNDIAKTIALGVPDKGMITWKNTFSKDQILALASYVMSLHGSNPPNPKAPQGKKYDY